MGLAEPRKRLKISHDPNNLAWSQSAESYGQKLLSSQGWKPGQGLGARNAKHFNSSSIPKLAISYKDDTLGLGASLKSQDPVHTRTGLDAFQGLLGRLNGKSDAELKKDVQKNEDKKLAMWAQGRWGGVTFVPGGKLVQGDGYKKSEEESKEELEPQVAFRNRNDVPEVNDMVERKAEKKKRKEKRWRSEVMSGTVEATASSAIPCLGLEEPESHAEPTKSNFSTVKRSSKEKRKMKRERPNSSVDGNTRASTAGRDKGESDIATSESLSQTLTVAKTSAVLPRTGRHVIRGRNIEAKKMAFSDAKMLNQIFMIKS